MPKLSINVDHVATLREARRATYPDPVEAARIAEAAGAHGITVHLRGDRRHIQERDVLELRQTVKGKLNLEMAVTDEMVAIARELRPDQVTFVPERAEEVTTEGGLDLSSHGDRLVEAAAPLLADGIAISVFLDPDEEQVNRLGGLPDRTVGGFEINTDSYSRAAPTQRTEELTRIERCARLGRSLGFEVYAGHGLTVENIGDLAALPEIEEFNIGHSIVSRAVLLGMEKAVAEMLSAIRAASD
jgi:pyridoxine 5-phosphate synthase